ncbi:ALQxL family class IV lanthipeptide [Streptomyces sp. NPDC059456]
MELDLDALQQLPAEEQQAGVCRYTCCVSRMGTGTGDTTEA